MTDFRALDLDKTYTYADYLTWMFDERVELIKGGIFKMSPAPTSWHQTISGNVFHELKLFIKKNPCKVFSAPFDVRLAVNSQKDKDIITVVQPDICIICDVAKIDEKGCNGAPDLIVEILSPATSKRDVKDKYQLYEENGVKEYWIVHPEEQILEAFILDQNGNYCLDKMYVKGDQLTSSIFEDMLIDLDDVFQS